MNKIKTVFLAVFSLLVCSAFVEAHAAGVPAKPKDIETIAVTKIVATPALAKKISGNPAERESLDLVAQSLSGLFTAALGKTRRFKIVTRKDIDAMQKEQDFSDSGMVDASSKNAARAGKIEGAKYIVSAEIYDFRDSAETKRFATLGKTKTRRDLRFKVTISILDSSTGEIIATDRFESKNSVQAVSGINSDSDTDGYVSELAEDVADKLAFFVADTIFPPQVIGKTGKRVTINRGEGSGVKVGQVWELYAPGEEMLDPDTGENLGSEEIPVGKMTIIQVNPKFSVGNATEDFGIERGALARRIKNKTKSASKK